MKKIITIVIAVLLFTAIGCRDQNMIVQPDGMPSTDLSYSPSANSVNAATSVSSGDQVNKQFIRNIKIDGSVGGSVKFKLFAAGSRQLEGILKIDAGAFSDVRVFDAVFDLETLTVELTPHGEFVIPAHLDLRFMGYDLKTYFPSLPKKNPVYYYLPESGTPEIMPYAFVNYEFNTNVIFFKDIRLPHFSRFGFIRLSDAPAQ